ncbi:MULTISPECIES: LysR family transcriptional regulator [Pseudomonas]|uniref:LysR family transcriptional regulator n=1 Tax=Pseudomonas fulva TaxID=47880 RepID=A0A0D0JX71_9PSED|nr:MULTISPECIES: LysR family transcriptional regulator [Pseudomonas]KIQ00229.1 LysR family transcriptional regulator [Pseudomonas fulva]
MEHLNSLAVFVRAAEARSFVGAAQAVGLSASAVGKAIARLENRLGTRLFHRSTRSITLTAEGVRFLQRCKHILAEIEDAEAELQQSSTHPQGRLRISLPAVGTLFAPVFSDFMKRYPDIELDIDFTDRLVDVIDEGFDAVIRTGKPSDSRLTFRNLGSFKVVLVASPRYLEDLGTPRIASDLRKHKCIHYRFPNSGKLQEWPLKSKSGAMEVDLPTTMISNNTETRVFFATQGHGLAYLPDFLVRDSIKSGNLVRVLEKQVDIREAFYLLWPASKFPSPKMRALVDYLSDNFLKRS